MDDGVKAKITQDLSEIILEVMPDAVTLDKYGGVVVERVAGRLETQCCGIFTHAKHVSLDFTDGAKLEDPSNILEGSGKQRRHIKLKVVEDVKTKRCREFLEQVINL